MRPSQSLSTPSAQLVSLAGGGPQSCGQLHGVSPGSQLPSPQNGAAPLFTALWRVMRRDPSNPMYAGFCALMLSTVSRTRAQTCAALHEGLCDQTAAAVEATSGVAMDVPSSVAT